MGVFLQKLCQKKNCFSIFGIEKKHCKTKELRFYQGPKMDIFRGVSPWILSKNRSFLMGVFHRNNIRKDRF